MNQYVFTALSFLIAVLFFLYFKIIGKYSK